MSISDDVPGKIPYSSAAAMTAGLARMGRSDVDVVVTEDFVKAVRDITAEPDYHDDRNGGRVAARTVPAKGRGSIVVANWEVLAGLTDVEVERVLAHEAGHASIESRDESPWSHISSRFADHWWNRQVAYGAAVAIDEFRCEAAVYAAGYPTGPGLADEDVADDLFGLTVQLLGRTTSSSHTWTSRASATTCSIRSCSTCGTWGRSPLGTCTASLSSRPP